MIGTQHNKSQCSLRATRRVGGQSWQAKHHTMPWYCESSDRVSSTVRFGRSLLLHRLASAKFEKRPIRRPTLPESGCISLEVLRLPRTTAAIASAAATAAATSMSAENALAAPPAWDPEFSCEEEE